ncbi:hypothetical protein [Desulfoluna spongiiphila]|uniref:Signal transduction histidine kinase dimerisation/phosphoacceptor domain-containing protein n=1 Tax=Desulfoluna spongiiphila TaxID=419481 RepID=A0A1G5IVT3_9BACT|nr:hypothetical protein [Desulfoluna spongiiphila]SCY79729.1 hypothetical protein SAMN05216233_12235 [Desulfoluna spongiiphila]
MSPQTPDQETTALMGAVTAPATHDLMNVLAIINEHAGLLSDLLHFKGNGDLSPEQLGKSIAAIETQVARGRGLLSHLNRLAHAPDPGPLGPTDAGIALEEIVALTQRHFHGRITAPVPSVSMPCEPVKLRLLLFRLLEAASHPAQAQETPVTPELTGATFSITFQGHGPVDLSEPLCSLAQGLGGTLTCHHHSLCLTLTHG